MKGQTRQLWWTRLILLAFFAALAAPLGWIAWQLWGAAGIHAQRDSQTEQARQHGLSVQHAAIKRCRDRGGFAAMGFAEVICLEGSAIKWSEEVPW